MSTIKDCCDFAGITETTQAQGGRDGPQKKPRHLAAAGVFP